MLLKKLTSPIIIWNLILFVCCYFYTDIFLMLFIYKIQMLLVGPRHEPELWSSGDRYFGLS